MPSVARAPLPPVPPSCQVSQGLIMETLGGQGGPARGRVPLSPAAATAIPVQRWDTWARREAVGRSGLGPGVKMLVGIWGWATEHISEMF